MARKTHVFNLKREPAIHSKSDSYRISLRSAATFLGFVTLPLHAAFFHFAVIIGAMVSGERKSSVLVLKMD